MLIDYLENDDLKKKLPNLDKKKELLQQENARNLQEVSFQPWNHFSNKLLEEEIEKWAKRRTKFMKLKGQ